VLTLAGCVQPAMIPAIDAATMRVLAALGVGTKIVAESGYCGAVNFHLDAQEAALDQMRANIDAWYPYIESGQAEAIVMNASGCVAMVREYGHYLRHDPRYAEKAAKISVKGMDIAEFSTPHAAGLRRKAVPLRAAPPCHPHCTLKHWQRLRAQTAWVLSELAFQFLPVNGAHLCCGAAGTY